MWLLHAWVLLRVLEASENQEDHAMAELEGRVMAQTPVGEEPGSA